MVGVSSPASRASRTKGTSQPHSRATAMMAASSEDRITRSRRRAPRAASIVQAMRGLPPAGRTFLPGSPLEPPRAGITASTGCESITGRVLVAPLLLRALELLQPADVEPVLAHGVGGHVPAAGQHLVEERGHVEEAVPGHQLEDGGR